jgi:dipeptidase D
MTGGLLSALEPHAVWSLFEQITRVPRCSGKEEQIRRWVLDWAGRSGVEARSDQGGNVLLSVPAARGCSHYQTLTLQAHMDMVCAAESGLSFDFACDPLPVAVEGETVTARGTTLGADNGIGMALALAALTDRTVRHGPLEALFTVNEENGFTGAFAVKPGFFSGSVLINLDSEDLGQITVGSAGGEFTDYTFPVGSGEAHGDEGIELAVGGLRSGHSGIHIHLPRLNAIKVAVEALELLNRRLPGRLSRFEGGTAVNSIPPSARCCVLVPPGQKAAALRLLEEWRRQTLRKASDDEPGMRIEIKEAAEPKAWHREQSEELLGLLQEIPQGPLSFSREIQGLVETSNNLGVLRMKKDAVEVLLNCRSSVDSALAELSGKLREIGERHGAQVRQHDRYPGWMADPASAFSLLVKESYQEVLGRPAELKAYHAGLECGVFKGTAPEVAIVSIGPTLKNVHGPGEQVEIRSVGIIWQVIRRVMESLDTLDTSRG